ncbi:MAG: response regulator [Actinomycetota bacterium]|nr:response regulator [Actinomycetota bacterium]
MGQRILLVDDEQRILDAMRRTLHGRYEVFTANSGEEGLQALRESSASDTPFTVIVSDMMMPGMDGSEFLGRAHEVLPDAVLMILSGQADLNSTITAVNNANLFRFLTKPVRSPDLWAALDAAQRQYELVVAERELLQLTLTGAVGVLADVLAQASSPAGRRTTRVRTLVTETARRRDLQDDWRLPLAADLSQLGCIAVPTEVLETVEAGGQLTDAERRIFEMHPALAHRLISRIPRLEEIARWIGEQTTVQRLESTGHLEDAEEIFAACVAFMVELDSGEDPRQIVRYLENTDRYSRRVLEAVRLASHGLKAKGTLREVGAVHIHPGMILAEDVVTMTGMVLVRKGEEVNEMLATRIANFARSVGVVEPLRVLTMG